MIKNIRITSKLGGFKMNGRNYRPGIPMQCNIKEILHLLQKPGIKVYELGHKEGEEVQLNKDNYNIVMVFNETGTTPATTIETVEEKIVLVVEETETEHKTIRSVQSETKADYIARVSEEEEIKVAEDLAKQLAEQEEQERLAKEAAAITEEEQIRAMIEAEELEAKNEVDNTTTEEVVENTSTEAVKETKNNNNNNGYKKNKK